MTRYSKKKHITKNYNRSKTGGYRGKNLLSIEKMPEAFKGKLEGMKTSIDEFKVDDLTETTLQGKLNYICPLYTFNKIMENNNINYNTNNINKQTIYSIIV